MHSASSKLRGAAADALSASAKAMSLSAHLMEGLSGLLRPTEPEPSTEEPATAAPTEGAGAGGATPAPEGPGPVPAAPADLEELPAAGAPTDAEAPPAEPVAGVPEHVRTSETHVEALADKPAAQVIRAVEQLSTDELERLYSHEQSNRRRKTVLAAIERSLSPRGADQT